MTCLLLALTTSIALAQDTPDAPRTRPEAPEAADGASAEEAEEDTGKEEASKTVSAKTSIAVPSPVDVSELQLRVAVLDAELAAQREALEALQGEADVEEDEDGLDVSIEGHFRTRAHLYNHLFASQTRGKEYLGDARYIESRLRLRPVFAYQDLASLTTELDLLDGWIWGDNQSLASTALFAGDPSGTGRDGQELAPLRLRRAWVDFKVPVGKLQIGRQSATWGMGLLANDGDGFDVSFGEKRYGTIQDRILFATRPIAVVQGIAGKDDSEVPLFAVVAVDRLVEDPLTQFYGFKCEAGLQEADPSFDRRCDTNGDGVTDVEHSWDDDSFTPENRSADWWADQDDDVKQMVYVLVYKGEDTPLFGTNGDLTAGAWVVHRTQAETDSQALIFDGYFKSLWRSMLVEFEGIMIRGDTRAIVLPSSNKDPLRKDAVVDGWVGRAGVVRDGWSAVFETGYASGDEDVTDDTFTGRPLHPDHNVGLLLYEEVLAQVTSTIWTTSGQGLWSNGGVYNSRYIFPTLTVSPIEHWEVVAGTLMAWPDRPDGAVIRCRDGDKGGCNLPSTQQAEDGPIGWEIDLAVKHQWQEHMRFSLEGGVAKATDRLPLEAAGLNPEGKFFTVQSRIAWEF